MKFYFDPTEFPFDGDFKNSPGTWAKLLGTIFRQAAENGFHLLANGARVASCRVLSCNRFRICTPTANAHTPADYRASFIRSDRRAGSRGATGITGARRKNSSRPTTKSETCSCKVVIGVDSSGYFVMGGRGDKQHRHHPKLMTKVVALASREITFAEKEKLGVYRSAGLSCAGAAQVFRTTSDVYLTPSAVRAYTQSIDYGEISNVDLLPKVKVTTTDRLFESLQRDRHDHIFLSHRGTANPNPGVEITNFVPGSSPTTSDFLLSIPSHERILMEAFVSEHRLSRNVPPTQDMFLAVVWMTAAERSLFRRFPFVIKIDITFATNSRGIPLLTVTGKTSDNQVFTVLRCWLPNEQAWIFRWFLLFAMPTILGKDIHRIKLIISDGDSQEIAQINNLIDTKMKTAHRLRCAWHLIDRSWNRCVYAVPKEGKTQKKRLYAETSRKILFSWMYSWMTKGTETEEEYEVSKALFLYYLEGSELRKKIGPDLVESVQTMYRKSIYPFEANFVFHRRRTRRAFEEFTSTTQEASFSGMKRSSLRVLPTMDIDTSLQQLNRQAENKCTRYEAAALAGLSKSALWSSIPSVTDKMVPYGAGLLETEWNRRNDCKSVQVSAMELRVVHDGPDEERDNVPNLPFLSSFVPRFRRVRTVRLLGVYLLCDCGHFERVGMPCRHLWHVLSKYWNIFCPVITDIHPMWHAAYKAYAFSRDADGNKLPASASVEAYAKTYDLEVVGPRAPSLTPELQEPLEDPGHEDFQILPVADRCLNWPKELIERLCLEDKASGLPAMSQDVNIYTQESDDEDARENSDWQQRFSNDGDAVQKIKEEKEQVFAAMIPLWKELMCSVEKAPESLPGTCDKLRKIIASLNHVEGGAEESSSESMALPLSVGKKRKGM
jgi:hypothetical protein